MATCALAAAALAWAMEIDRADVIAGLEAVQIVGGHLEAVVEGQDFDVRIDAAQTPDRDREALAACGPLPRGRVHLVIERRGSGDRAMRRQLAEIAENGADRVILTLSNPRTEDPNQILDDLLAGFRRPGKVRVEADRRIAIEAALPTPGRRRRPDRRKGAIPTRSSQTLFVPFDDHATLYDVASGAMLPQWTRCLQREWPPRDSLFSYL